MQIDLVTTEFPLSPPIARKDGVHLSDILDILYPFPGEITDKTRRKFELGFLWEHVLSAAFSDMSIERPAEILKDGIWMSPDGVEKADIGNILHEYKFTWKGTAKFELEMQQRYLAQVKSYCLAVNTDTCIFHYLFVNGDYKWNSGDGFPLYRKYKVVFTEKELLENWTAIVNTARFYKLISSGGDNDR